MEKYAGKLPAVLFAIALLDACIIGACAVSLSTAYAIGDVLSLRHSLHRKPTDAKGFYAIYCGLIALAVALVLTPGISLGLLTNAVQTLAGMLLPSATVFLLRNDKAVLGPWVNRRGANLFAGAIVAVLVMLSIILTASVLYPDISVQAIIGILTGGSALSVAAALVGWAAQRSPGETAEPTIERPQRDTWQMPPLADLGCAPLHRSQQSGPRLRDRSRNNVPRPARILVDAAAGSSIHLSPRRQRRGPQRSARDAPGPGCDHPRRAIRHRLLSDLPLLVGDSVTAHYPIV